jgi:hypothetical protein
MMKAKELIERLQDHPDADVTFSVDISTGEDDWWNRIFGDEVYEVIQHRTGPPPDGQVHELVICFRGEVEELEEPT